MLGALPGGARALAEGVPLRPRRRVPGHEPRAVPAAAAAGRRSTATSARSATRTRAIYAFRGADIRNILEFERDFGETKTVALEQNYRSTNTILQAANAVIAHNRERKPKNLWSELGEGEPVRALEVEDEHAEARFVAAEIAALVEEGFSGSEVAVFYRTNAQSRVLEDVLVRQGVAYQVIGGPRFYERAEVKDVIAYLQAIDNPYDAVSLQRIANRPRRGIGDALARAAAGPRRRVRDSRSGRPSGRPRRRASRRAPLRAVQQFHGLAAVADGRRARHGGAGRDRARARAQRLPRVRCAPSGRSKPRGRIENLQELVGVAQEYQHTAPEPSLSGFLQEISLYSDQDAIRGEQSLVTLMTLHNAKGLEFRAVFMIGMEEGIFPHARSIEEQGLEEERRLAYVGMTRAQERLVLTHASAALALRQPLVQPAFALPRRAAGDREVERQPAPAGLVVRATARRPASRLARIVPLALDRRLGPARRRSARASSPQLEAGAES